MKDARSGKPVVGQFRHPIPREAALLATPPERSTPEVGHVMSERRERPTIGGYRIVSEMACHDLPQPVTLIWDSLVHSQPQLRLDFLELRLHAVAPGLPLKLEESPAHLLQMKVKPRNAKVSGLLTPRFLRLTAARRPNSITRVLTGWSDSENAASSRIASRKRRASSSC